MNSDFEDMEKLESPEQGESFQLTEDTFSNLTLRRQLLVAEILELRIGNVTTKDLYRETLALTDKIARLISSFDAGAAQEALKLTQQKDAIAEILLRKQIVFDKELVSLKSFQRSRNGFGRTMPKYDVIDCSYNVETDLSLTEHLAELFGHERVKLIVSKINGTYTYQPELGMGMDIKVDLNKSGGSKVQDLYFIKDIRESNWSKNNCIAQWLFGGPARVDSAILFCAALVKKAEDYGVDLSLSYKDIYSSASQEKANKLLSSNEHSVLFALRHTGGIRTKCGVINYETFGWNRDSDMNDKPSYVFASN